ncbi:hypothetical protein BDD12DRAFT_886375 [Trichophaea hybrida]|nr:hypothetical protein BDD12DRAFT_886375 [Trichophaea hybrida]
MASRKRPEIYRVTGIPLAFTSATLKSALSERLPYEANYGALAIDKNMYGLTQLYTTTPGERVVADIFAITGIAGHAYGSWRAAGDFLQMWLRDFLAEDFPNCRTMTYGYNSKLESMGIHQIIDYN